MLPAVVFFTGVLCVLVGLLLARPGGSPGRAGRHASLVRAHLPRRHLPRGPGRHAG